MVSAAITNASISAADPQVLLDRGLRRAIVAALGDEFANADPAVRVSQNPQFGDYQANAAMALAKQLSLKPRDVAQRIVDAAPPELLEIAQPLEIAGPGFINIRLRADALGRLLNVMADDARLGLPAESDPPVVVIDYSSPNVAKEMHVGHLRSTIIGDTFARVLTRLYGGALADRVIRQNHLGDWGTQFGRVMLGLWYEAVAMKVGEVERLNSWIERARQVPKQKAGESKQDQVVRLNAERSLLDEIVPWHLEHYNKDRKGDTYFDPYIENHFPDLLRLQKLYTFTTAITEFESASENRYRIPTQEHGVLALSALPSLFARFVQRGDSQEQRAWEKSLETTLRACRQVYALMNITLTDVDLFGESKYQGMLQPIVDELKSKGIAELNEGALCVFLPGFTDPSGKPTPIIVQKSDQSFGYATTDLAAIRHRVQTLGAERVIYVVDARQRDHFRAVFQIANMASWDRTPSGRQAELKHVPFGAVLGEDRRPLKTRSGENVTLMALLEEAIERGTSEVLKRAQSPDAPTHGLSQRELESIGKAVGIGAVKYADLSNDLVRDYVFNFDRMIAFEGNTGPYMQYAHARVCSIFSKAKLPFDHAGGAAFAISHDAEKRLALALLRYGGVVADVARTLEPHRLCAYLYELADAFSAFYEACPVIKAHEEATRKSRLRLSDLTRRVLADGLELLGIDAPQRM